MGSCVGGRKKIVRNLNSNVFVTDNQILDRFTNHQIGFLNRFFKTCSTNSYVEKKRFLQLFPNLKVFPQQVINKCFQIFSDGTPQITFRTFCLILAQLLLSSKEDQSKFVFCLFDLDSDQKLNEQELNTFFKSQSSYLRKLSENDTENIKLHKEKIGRIPVEQSDFLSWSLRNIELSDLLKPFEIIPSAITEKQIISSKLLNNENLEINEYVYLVNNEWWDVWKYYVRFDPEIEDFEESTNEYASILPLNRKGQVHLGEKPVAIDNSKLLEGKGSLKLKGGIRYKFDFIWAKKDVWELLYTWYGGGPVIKRKVLYEHNKAIIELYPLMFYIIPIDSKGTQLDNKRKSMLISKTETIGQLLETVCISFDRSLEYSRLLYKQWNTWNICDNLRNINILEENSELLLETGFIEKSVLLWPRECRIAQEQKIISSVAPESNTASNNTIVPNPEKQVLKATSIVVPGISGLVNLGNTCFLNSVLQSILHTPMLSEFFTGDSVASLIHPSKDRGGVILALELNALAKEIVANKFSKVNPLKFHKSFIRVFPFFDGVQQHDCHECLSAVLDTLHEELRRVGDNNVSNILSLENPVDKEFEMKEADEQWKSLQGNKGSLISDVCGGQSRRTLICEQCGNRKVLFEIFNNLSLPIPASMEIPLNITVVFLNGKITQVAVLINKFAKISELSQEVAKIVFLAKEKIILAEYYSGSILKNLKPYENESLLLHIRESSNLFAYETIVTIAEAEAQGKKVVKYIKQGPFYGVSQHVDVLTSNDTWKSGKIIEIQGQNYEISLDYEETTEIYELTKLAPFRAHTNIEATNINTFVIYHQAIRNKKVITLGFPQIVSIGSWYTHSDLYDLAYEISMGLCAARDLPENTNVFSIKVLDTNTLRCGLCKKCDGCNMIKTKNELKSLEGICLGVEWQESFFRQDIIFHESVKEIADKKIKTPIDISNCFDAYMNKEKIDSKCEKCGHKESSTQIDIWRVPDILILSLKRFAFQKGIFDKIDQPISLPFYAFDISQWVKGVETSGGLTLNTTSLQNAYDLYAIILHSGGITSGHYTALIKINTDDDSMWILFDDSSLYLLKEDPDNINITQNAYMLFYKRRKFSSSNIINLTSNFV